MAASYVEAIAYLTHGRQAMARNAKQLWDQSMPGFEPTKGWTFQGADGVHRPMRLIGGVHDIIERVNAERTRNGRPMLSPAQANEALDKRGLGCGDGAADFLIGYLTGFPMPSVGGLVGALMHVGSDDAPASVPQHTVEAPVTPEPAATYDAGPSSYDGGSSSSSDSGGGASE